MKLIVTKECVSRSFWKQRLLTDMFLFLFQVRITNLLGSISINESALKMKPALFVTRWDFLFIICIFEQRSRSICKIFTMKLEKKVISWELSNTDALWNLCVTRVHRISECFINGILRYLQAQSHTVELLINID